MPEERNGVLRKTMRKSNQSWLIVFVFYMLLLQNPLEGAFPILKYIDEVFPLVGCAAFLWQTLRSGKLILTKSSTGIILAFLTFLMAGLLGDWIYQYQPTASVLTDLFTNMKFFLSVITGYVIFRGCDSVQAQNALAAHARFASVTFFAMLLLDQLFHVFQSPETRYGLRVSTLIYSHPTFLVGAMVFLLAILTAFYQEQNKPCIVMCLAVMFFTLRGKAIAGGMAYCLIFYFIVLYRKKLRLWHIVLIALAALLMAGEQLSYYYIENSNSSARAVLTSTSFQIMGDYFPIGTGFGTYASSAAVHPYSPVYLQYGLYRIYGLSQTNSSFACDAFWPIIIGQTGLIGTLGYLYALVQLFFQTLKCRSVSIHAYAASIFIFAYLLISSTSETAFNNLIAVPLGVMLGHTLSLKRKRSSVVVT